MICAKGSFLWLTEFTNLQNLGSFEHGLEVRFPAGRELLFLDFIFMRTTGILHEIEASSVFIEAEKRIFILKKLQLSI